jgi:hypothetical protein
MMLTKLFNRHRRRQQNIIGTTLMAVGVIAIIDMLDDTPREEPRFSDVALPVVGMLCLAALGAEDAIRTESSDLVITKLRPQRSEPKKKSVNHTTREIRWKTR